MANTRPKRNAANFTFRLSPDEKRAAEALAARRVEAAAAAGFEADPSIGALLRHLIRREAAAAGIEIPGETVSTPKPTPKRRKTARG